MRGLLRRGGKRLTWVAPAVEGLTFEGLIVEGVVGERTPGEALAGEITARVPAGLSAREPASGLTGRAA